MTAKLGARIHELRMGRHWSLEDLANASGLSKGHLSSIEHGLFAITAETIERVARGLGVRPLCLFGSSTDDVLLILELIEPWSARELKRLRVELTARQKAYAKGLDGKTSSRH